MKLVVGCPVRERGWAVEKWFDHVLTASGKVKVSELIFLFVGPSEDFTENGIVSYADYIKSVHGVTTHFVDSGEPASNGRFFSRDWNLDRYEKMVFLRNLLLKKVRKISPLYFWSVDSDILVHPDALKNSIQSCQSFDAVASKTYLGKGTNVPNFAFIGNQVGLRRYEYKGVCRVDVIMALKLMSLKAYFVDYEVHHKGEDIGWSLKCRKKRVTLGFDGRCASKHIMDPSQIDHYDPRCRY